MIEVGFIFLLRKKEAKSDHDRIGTHCISHRKGFASGVVDEGGGGREICALKREVPLQVVSQKEANSGIIREIAVQEGGS